MIRSIAQNRGIKNLYHFTRLSNLRGILGNGLIPREELDNSDTEHEVNDEDRHDNCEDGNCLSISFPNYKMFYSLRQGDKSIIWVVLRIQASVMWEKECAFCHENAASNDVTCIPIDFRKGSDALERIFDEVDGMPLRREMEIPKHCPTNPQAELLVFDVIEPHFILDINFENMTQKKLKKMADRFTSHKILRNGDLFYPRSDYKYWSKVKNGK